MCYNCCHSNNVYTHDKRYLHLHIWPIFTKRDLYTFTHMTYMYLNYLYLDLLPTYVCYNHRHNNQVYTYDKHDLHLHIWHIFTSMTSIVTYNLLTFATIIATVARYTPALMVGIRTGTFSVGTAFTIVAARVYYWKVTITSFVYYVNVSLTCCILSSQGSIHILISSWRIASNFPGLIYNSNICV